MLLIHFLLRSHWLPDQRAICLKKIVQIFRNIRFPPLLENREDSLICIHFTPMDIHVFAPPYDQNPYPGATDFPIEVKDLIDIINMYKCNLSMGVEKIFKD